MEDKRDNVLNMEEALKVYARYLTDDHGFLWPDPFVLWAYKRNYRLIEVCDDKGRSENISIRSCG
uniref:Uncharacterized protein n=1 Tax=viral metagenome TaxID=1070528 RepID=A0A6M3LFH1_9ZZZZ